jgi:flavin reductase
MPELWSPDEIDAASAETTVDLQAYRTGMSKLAAAVNIITSDGPAGRCGFTASAVCSVTDKPPTLLVCINRSAQSNPMVKINGVLCVNTIDDKHQDLSTCFAGAHGVKDMATRFAGGEWFTLATGAPLLVGAAASFDCRIVEITQMGTHDVLFCEVRGVAHDEAAGGLVYLNRNFCSLPTHVAGAAAPQESHRPHSRISANAEEQ